MSKIRYQPELDGLRAIAVLAVIIYHLKINISGSVLLSGGFFGVDVFFVLSGFLISKMLFLEIENNGKISFFDFYIRRARRILPPLLFMILLSGCIGFFVLLPGEFERLSESSVATLGFFSNIFWFLKLSEYGAQSGLLQPLLHTWSLSIEEQFYFIFPLFLALVLKYNKTVRKDFIYIVLIISFTISIITTTYHQYISFYSPISRAWELLSGSILALSLNRNSKYKGFDVRYELFTIISIIVLFIMFLEIKLEDVSHPGFATIPVIMSSMIIIAYAEKTYFVKSILINRFMISIGKLSYSLYLWHFPVFAYGRHLTLEFPSYLEMFIWILITFAISIISYFLVEKPFRYWLSNTRAVFSLGASSVTIIVLSVLILINDGYSERLNSYAKLYDGAEYDNEKLSLDSWSLLYEISNGQADYFEKIANQPNEYEINHNWFTANSKLKVLIVGNSHSKDLFNSLYLNKEIFNDIEFARFGMSENFPNDQIDLLLSSKNFDAADLILIAPKYSSASISRVDIVIDKIKNSSKKVALVGNTAEFKSPSSLPLFDWYIRKYGSKDIKGINEKSYTYLSKQSIERDNLVKKISDRLEIPYFSRIDIVCSIQSEECTLATYEGKKALYDYGHWTLAGAKYFGEKIQKSEWFDKYLVID